MTDNKGTYGILAEPSAPPAPDAQFEMQTPVVPQQIVQGMAIFPSSNPQPQMNIVNWSTFPQIVVCPFWGQQTMTTVKRQPGLLTWLSCFGVMMVCCPASCVPFLIPDWQDANHHCGNCGRFLARKEILKL